MTKGKITPALSRGAQQPDTTAPVYIRGPQLRRRWAKSSSSFYELLSRGVIPAPCYPFGPKAPHWRMSDILAFEERAAEANPVRGD